MGCPPLARVLLIGTFHFGSTDDAIEVEFDALSPERQGEILEVCESLAAFGPLQ